MKKILRISLFTLMAGAALAGLSAAERASSVSFTSASNAAEVKIDNFSFGPQSITVPAGTIVTWKNRDDIPHTVVSTDGVFKSRVLDTDETFSFTFDKPGTFPYFCSIHPKMTGTVVVQ